MPFIGRVLKLAGTDDEMVSLAENSGSCAWESVSVFDDFVAWESFWD